MDAEAGEAGVQQPAGAASTSTAAVPFDRSSSRLGAPGAESFDGALRELKDLRSQLHEAADCCAKAFLSTDKKKISTLMHAKDSGGYKGLHMRCGGSCDRSPGDSFVQA